MVLVTLPILAADQSGRAWLDKSADFAASAPAFRRVDTSEQSVVAILGQERVKQAPQTNVVIIEIEMSKNLARETTRFQGKELIMLKQGEKAAMKLGDGPWEIPTALFTNMARDMGKLFVCEIETPETKANAPAWKVAGTEFLGGQEALLIESEGNTAVPIARARMAKAMAKAFAGDPAQRPSVKVLEYSARHWISKTDYRHLQAVQVSKVEMSISLPEGRQQLMEQSSKTTSKYCYDDVRIEIPEEARRILTPEDSAGQ